MVLQYLHLSLWGRLWSLATASGASLCRTSGDECLSVVSFWPGLSSVCISLGCLRLLLLVLLLHPSFEPPSSMAAHQLHPSSIGKPRPYAYACDLLSITQLLPGAAICVQVRYCAMLCAGKAKPRTHTSRRVPRAGVVVPDLRFFLSFSLLFPLFRPLPGPPSGARSWPPFGSCW